GGGVLEHVRDAGSGGRSCDSVRSVYGFRDDTRHDRPAARRRIALAYGAARATAGGALQLAAIRQQDSGSLLRGLGKYPARPAPCGARFCLMWGRLIACPDHAGVVFFSAAPFEERYRGLFANPDRPLVGASRPEDFQCCW